MLTKKEQTLLTGNHYVKSVSDKAITYTDEFNCHFIVENENGKLPRDIFEKAGLSADLIGMEQMKTAGKRWRTAVEGL